MTYDIIGDVHGHVDRLRALLKLMDYSDEHGAWRHRERSAVFVGDLIDRGPDQIETLRLVRSMVDAGSAQVVLGNHEFNAVAYAKVDPKRLDYCRPHSGKNDGQHEAFLADVEFGSPLHRSIIGWFMEFPLWLDLGGMRVVHACWSDRHIGLLRGQLDPGCTLNERVVIDGTTKGTDTYDAIETVLKGPEVHLDGVRFDDEDGNTRHNARLRWWDGGATGLRDAALIPSETQLFDADGLPLDQLHDRPLRNDEVAPYRGSVPVLFGHYWWRKEDAERINEMATCVDYSVAKNGVLRAYQWDGKQKTIDPTKFVDC
jgi:hypothetical protein